MIYVNCAALPEALAESELFGHCRGAFTGATADRKGKFESANGGTLLLDEVSELPLTVQAKLSRVLQSGEIQRLGCNRQIRADVRILATTNGDIKQEVARRRFRADLYHSLSIFPLRVPPLRDRGRDTLVLADHFLARNQQGESARNVRLSASAKEALLAYDWPGNVRELEHLMDRATLLAAAEQGRNQRWITIEHSHLAPLAGAGSAALLWGGEPAGPSMESMTLAEAIADYRRQWLHRILREHRGNLAAAARVAGIDRSNFVRLVKRLGLR
jgi:anaerobic nitric oxide reductase transcription regulator